MNVLGVFCQNSRRGCNGRHMKNNSDNGNKTGSKVQQYGKEIIQDDKDMKNWNMINV